MASILDLMLALTDPGTAVILGFVYLRLRALTDRVARLEDTFIGGGNSAITDGGRVEESE